MRLAYDIVGPADASAIVLLHGLTSNRQSYADIVSELAWGWRVINADLRGHGETGVAPRYHAWDYADDVAELIEAVGAAPAVVVGHSLGGLAASALAMARPDLLAGVFLEDPPLFEGDAEVRAASPAARFFPPFVNRIRGWQRDGTSIAEIAALLGQQPTPHGDLAAERFGSDRLTIRAEALLAFDPAAMDSAIGGAMWTDYDPTTAIACPMTVVAADPAVGAVFLPDHGVSLIDANPKATVSTIAGQAHGIHEDPAGRVPYLEALRQFLSSLTG